MALLVVFNISHVGLVGNPEKDDICMIRDDIGGPGDPLQYVAGSTGT